MKRGAHSSGCRPVIVLDFTDEGIPVTLKGKSVIPPHVADE